MLRTSWLALRIYPLIKAEEKPVSLRSSGGCEAALALTHVGDLRQRRGWLDKGIG